MKKTFFTVLILICSINTFGQNFEKYNSLIAEALYNKEKVGQLRTLTMLALSANGYSPKSDKQGETK